MHGLLLIVEYFGLQFIFRWNTINLKKFEFEKRLFWKQKRNVTRYNITVN